MADRLNLLLAVGLWLWIGSFTFFWLQTLIPVRPFMTGPPPIAAWPWFLAALAGAAAVFVLPPAYYRTARIEGLLYPLLDVALFRMAVPDGDLVNRAVRRRYPRYRAHAFGPRLAELERSSFVAERAHLTALIGGCVATLYACRIGFTGWAWWLGLSNLICNLYPILLQRHTRVRLDWLRARRAIRKES